MGTPTMAKRGSGGPFCVPIPGPIAQMVAFTRLRIARLLSKAITGY